MPFLNQLKKTGFYCENMYSQAPYTEAALMNLICGQNVLDYGGYMFRYKDTPLVLLEAMQKKGLETYTSSYVPQCHPSSVLRGLDVSVSEAGYDIGALWSYRIKHYSKLYKRNSLNDEDYNVLNEIINDNLLAWIRWLDELASDSYSVSMIRDNAPQYDRTSVRKRVEEQYKAYVSDRKKYIINILEMGIKHPIFSIEGFTQTRKIKNREVVQVIKQELIPLFKRIRKMGFQLNFRNCKNAFRGPIKKTYDFLCKPSEESLKDVAKACFLTINNYFDIDLFDRIKKDCDNFKDAPSLRTNIDYFINWTKNRENKQKPYFAMFHACDIHNPEMFFTSDTEDIDLIKREISEANELLDNIPQNYCGSLTHDLSLRYIDGVIEYFYEQLKDNNMYEDTVVIICADHGFSFSGNPLRDSAIVNLYLENYNIPFCVTGAGFEGMSITKKCGSIDIPPTICDIVDGVIPQEFRGNSVLREFEYDNLIIEYCGGGCPDIKRRELKIAAFDDDYLVGTLGLLDDFSKKSITEIYNLRDDPMQLSNLIRHCYDEGKVDTLFNLIVNRKKILYHQISFKR